MTILLFNDNPVVRKLVALSAQKTKDELNVVWSVDEIEGDGYDLLIMDDALYSDETFEAVRGKVHYRSALLMATRGNAVPAGFDHVIHKPFLPTDLVDLFAQISQNLETSAPQETKEEEPLVAFDDAGGFAINLEEELPDLSFADEELLPPLDEEALEEESEALSGILDHDEVQEVQGLLEDTEDDALFGEEEAIDIAEITPVESEEEEPFDFASLEDFGIGEIPELSDEEGAEEDPFEIDGLLESLDTELGDAAGAEVDAFTELPVDSVSGTEAAEDVIGADEPESDEAWLSGIEADEAGISEIPSGIGGGNDDELLDEDLLALLDEELSAETVEDSTLDDLEWQIQEAVEDLSPEELEREIEPDTLELESDMAILSDLEEAGIGALEEVSELDQLDERALKQALGETVGETEETVETKTAPIADETVPAPSVASEKPSEAEMAPAEGVEALQALLKALANEEVAKSLKGLNISININFGNEK